MDLGIAGRWALVCGASKGLGFGCAEALAKEGVNLVVAARGAEALSQAATRLRSHGAQVVAVACDVTTPEGRETIWAAPGGPGKQLDILVTNAGGPPPGDFRQFDRDAWIRALDAMPMIVSSLCAFCISLRCGMLLRHGGHQVAQNSTT